MKRILLSLITVLFASANANAHGLYFSAGYGLSNTPQINIHRGACSPASVGIPGEDGACYITWDDEGYDEFFSNRWPAFYEPGDPDALANGMVLRSNAWHPGDAEKSSLNFDSTSHFAIAVGWDFPLSPFRVELEYARMSMKSNSYDLTITPTPEWTGVGDDFEFFPSLTFKDAPHVYHKTVNVDFTTTMINTYFEFPVFDYLGVGPYIGYGIGVGQLNFRDDVGIYGGSERMIVSQLMAGVDYRIPDTPYNIGIEFRYVNIPGMPDRDNKTDGWFFYDEELFAGSSLYGHQQSFVDYSHRSVMLKVRYDFMSDDF
ncbi:MAG: porin family protein [Alphaproteobacteria bacterium]|nr:porin family protein [Alphaproteobacteria bacterium]